MSRNIENRVVSMQFDNSNFEKNTAQSMSTIDRLKDKLNFSGSLKGIEKATNSLDLSGFTESISSVSNSFSAMETIAFSVLNNITNRATNAGISLIKSLSLDQINSGYSKYEMQVGAVQTIRNSLPEDTEDEVIDKALEKIQWLTDETSFRYSDILNTVGKFTGNEIALDDAVSALEGISLMVAVAGQSVQQASSAYYNIAQAMAAGSMKMIDWKSLQGANIVNVELKKTFMEIAANLDEEHRTLEKIGDGIYQTLDGTEVTVKSFESSMADGWITTEVMMETYKAYSEYADALHEKIKEFEEQGIVITTSEAAKYLEEEGRQFSALSVKAWKAAQQTKTFTEAIDYVKEAVSSKFATIFENIFGAYDDAVRMWSGFTDEVLYPVFVEPMERVSAIVAQWHALSYSSIFGYDEENEQYGAFFEMFFKLADLIQPIKDAWRDIFPEKNSIEAAKALQKITDKFVSLVEKMVWTDEQADKLKTAFTGVFSVFNSLIRIGKAVWKGLSPIKDAFVFLFETVVNLFAKIGDMFSKLTEGQKTVKILRTVQSFALTVENTIKSLVGYVEQFFVKFEENGGTIENFKKILDGLVAVFDIFKMLIKAIAKGIGDLLAPIFSTAADGAGMFAGTMFEGAASIGEFLSKLRDAISINNTFGNIVSKIVEKIKMGIEYVKTGFENVMGMSIGDFFKKLVGIVREAFSFIGELLKSILGDPESKKLNKKVKEDGKNVSFLGAIFEGLGDIIKSVAGVVKEILPVAKDIFSGVGNALIGIGKGIGEAVSNIDTERLKTILKGGLLIAFAAMLYSFVGWIKYILGFGGGFGMINYLKDFIASASEAMEAMSKKLKAEAYVSIAKAIGILAASLFLLSTIDSNKLMDSLLALGAMFAMLMVSMKVMTEAAKERNGVAGLTKVMGMLIAFAGAIAIVSLGFKILSTIDSLKLALSVASVLVLLEGFYFIGKQMSDYAKTAKKSAKAILTIAFAIDVLAPGMYLISLIPFGKMLTGLFGISMFLAIVGAVSEMKINTKNLTKISGTIAVFGVSLMAILPSLYLLGQMKISSVLKGLAAILGIGLSFMLLSKVKIGTSSIGKVMLTMITAAISASIFADSIAKLAQYPWDTILEATLGMVLVIGSIVAFSNYIGKIDGAALTTFVKYVLAFTGAILLIDLAILTSAATFRTAVTIIVAAFQELGTIESIDFSKSVGKIASFVAAFAELGLKMLWLTPLIMAFGVAIDILGVGIGIFATSMLTMALSINQFTKAAENLVEKQDAILKFAKVVGKAIVTFLNEVLMAIPEMINKFTERLLNALLGVLKAVSEFLPKAFEYLTNIVISISEFLLTMAPVIGETVLSLLGTVLSLLNEHITEIIEPIIEIVLKIIDAIAGKLDTIVQTLVDLIISLIDALAKALDENAPRIVESIKKLLVSVVSLVLQTLGIDQETAKGLAGDLVNGIDRVLGKIAELVVWVVQRILNDLGTAFEGIDQLLSDLFDNWEETWTNIKNFFVDLWNGIVTFVTSVKNKIVEVWNTISNKASEIWNSIVDWTKNTWNLGKNIIEGLINGIKDGFKKFGDGAEKIWNDVIEVAKKVFGIHSPSTVFAGLGGFLDKGLGLGIERNTGYITDSVKDMSSTVMDEVLDKKTGIAAAVQAFNDSLNGEIDSEPVIRPVIDLTNVRNANGAINSMFGDTPFTFTGSIQNANLTAGSMTANGTTNDVLIAGIYDTVKQIAADMSDEPNNTFENTFNITGSDPREIAQEVSDIIQRQVDRRLAAWG